MENGPTMNWGWAAAIIGTGITAFLALCAAVAAIVKFDRRIEAKLDREEHARVCDSANAEIRELINDKFNTILEQYREAIEDRSNLRDKLEIVARDVAVIKNEQGMVKKELENQQRRSEQRGTEIDSHVLDALSKRFGIKSHDR